MEIREVYHISDERFQNNGHYYFIFSYESAEGTFLAANCTHLHEGMSEDGKCIIDPKEYLGVPDKSYIAFKYTRLLNDKKIEELIEDGYIIKKQPVDASEKLIRKIQQGFHISKDVPGVLRPYGYFCRGILPPGSSKPK
ncbi:hypothetical protein SDC9_05179 [bioreactor metagenome]|uniref:Uncharacterized protein n=1 Tax=bioreactor metagenome TaxID=1076179 RepID=A0A644SYD5_9ZZZZ